MPLGGPSGPSLRNLALLDPQIDAVGRGKCPITGFIGHSGERWWWTKGQPMDTSAWASMRVARMDEGLNRLATAAREGTIPGGAIENGTLRLERLASNAPADADALVLDLYSRLPEVRITDILIEVDAATGSCRASGICRPSASMYSSQKTSPTSCAVSSAAGFDTRRLPATGPMCCAAQPPWPPAPSRPASSCASSPPIRVSMTLPWRYARSGASRGRSSSSTGCSTPNCSAGPRSGSTRAKRTTRSKTPCASAVRAKSATAPPKASTSA